MSNVIDKCGTKIDCIVSSSPALDVSVVLETKRTGAIMRNIPDDTAYGGDCRGPHAVDWQSSRLQSKQVASGPFAVISGGELNEASGLYATIGGGRANLAEGWRSVVAGGENNQALVDRSTVSGGYNNLSYGYGLMVVDGENLYGCTTVAGGHRNEATETFATVSGGSKNKASFLYSTVGGGGGNVSSSSYSTVGGGKNNTASHGQATVAGGDNNKASALSSTVGGGWNNKASANYSTVGGGQANQTTGHHATVAGGNNNQATGNESAIGGGRDNTVAAVLSTIGGGLENVIESSAAYSGIAGGRGLKLNSQNSFATGMYNKPGTIGGTSRIFMVGHGTSVNRRNLFSVDTMGRVRAQSYILESNADFGEYFESLSGEKIPYGTSVVFEKQTHKIRPARRNETPFGVVSATAGIIGNSADEQWIGTFERDADGKEIYEEVSEEIEVPLEEEKEIVVSEKEFDHKAGRAVVRDVKKTISVPVTKEYELYDDKGNLIGTETVVQTRKETTKRRLPKLSKEFDPSREYIPRAERKEWNVVGLTGVVKILDGQPIHPHWFKIKENLYLIK